LESAGSFGTHTARLDFFEDVDDPVRRQGAVQTRDEAADQLALSRAVEGGELPV
jgi:hypothetical protein